MIPTEEDGPTGKPVEILTRQAGLVPTGSPAADRDGPVGWQLAMKRAIRSSHELLEAVGLEPPVRGRSAVWRPGTVASRAGSDAEPDFPTFVPLEFLRRMRHGDPRDPLLRQVLAVPEEHVPRNGFSNDPVGDQDAIAAAGLLQKYDGRALVISTGVCGIHCRYCFRREFPYQQAGSRREHWRPAIDYVAQHAEIEEVILSGGDPLTLVDQQLKQLIDAIESIDHVRRLRIHTRMPIVIPQRVTSELVDILSDSRLAVWMVVHINHPQEIDRAVGDAISSLIDRGIPLLNQAVLLRGVNDDADALIELCRQLINHRVQPYYLHQLDRVAGAAHFEVPVQEGLELIGRVRASLPGYAVPTYVVEQPGRDCKTPILSSQPVTPATGQHVRP